MSYVITISFLIITVLFTYGLAWALGQTPAETAAWLALGGVVGHMVAKTESNR